jgi:hypothetical protein
MKHRTDSLRVSDLVSAHAAGESISSIARRHGVSARTVSKKLCEAGVDAKLAYANRRVHHFTPDKGLQEIIDGMLLGDAYINQKVGRRTASLCLAQRADRAEWLEQLQTELAAFGVKSVIDHREARVSVFGNRFINTKAYLVLRTLDCAEFVNERLRWYPQGRKVVPSDLVLTPRALAHWFAGDGRGGDRKGTLGFCTDGFALCGVEFLVLQLEKRFGVTSSIVSNYRGQPQILVGRRNEAVKIRDLISSYLPKCFQYKLQFVRPRQETGRGRRLTEQTKEAIKQEQGRCSMREAANKHKVSVSKVWHLWREL